MYDPNIVPLGMYGTLRIVWRSIQVGGYVYEITDNRTRLEGDKDDWSSTNSFISMFEPTQFQ